MSDENPEVTETEEKPVKKSAKRAGDFFDAIAAHMRESGNTNPREIPDVVVEQLRQAHGL